MTIGGNRVRWRWLGMVVVMTYLAWMYGAVLQAQSEQVVEVTIKDFRFVTKQSPLRLGYPTVIKVRNEDAERHDFSSTMFEGIPTQIEQDGVRDCVRPRAGGCVSRSETRRDDSI
ncbi:MAG TPA: hypothetical protein VN666_05090 [Nitrospira sp.]|nr:hypothetical protein [Nitrospira sp.]